MLLSVFKTAIINESEYEFKTPVLNPHTRWAYISLEVLIEIKGSQDVFLKT